MTNTLLRCRKEGIDMDKKPYENLEMDILYLDENVYNDVLNNSPGTDEDELPGMDIFG